MRHMRHMGAAPGALLTLWARRWVAVGAPPNRLAMEGGAVSPIRAAG
jgi:hypothetical protein